MTSTPSSPYDIINDHSYRQAEIFLNKLQNFQKAYDLPTKSLICRQTEDFPGVYDTPALPPHGEFEWPRHQINE